MDYVSKYLLLRYYDFLIDDYKQALALHNNETVQGFKNRLEQEVLFIPNLNSSEKEYLLMEFEKMDDEELEQMERINHKSQNLIYTLLKEGGAK